MRLFWHIFLTFVGLVVLGIGGVTLVLGTTFGNLYRDNVPRTVASRQQTWRDWLGDYYVANNRSWAGVDGRLAQLAEADSWSLLGSLVYEVYDVNGRPVAVGADRHVAGRGPNLGDGTPIIVRGERIGTLVVRTATEWRHSADTPNPSFGTRNHEYGMLGDQIARAFRLAVFTVGGIALGLALLLARRISAPLAALTKATQAVAQGKPPLPLRRSSVREVATLAHAFGQMTTDLARADQVRRNMTADIAHELRTPLTVIKGKLEGMLDGVYAPTPQHLEPVLEETNLLERLVDDLRLLSLAEAGHLPLYPEALAPGDLVEDVVHAFAGQAQTQGVALLSAVAPDLPLVYVDPQRMQQVLGNLVANSLRHTPPNGSITLHARATATGVELRVQDTGSGIASDALPHIFDRFWRGDKARQRHGSGAGLGLAIARHFIEAQGGTIRADSAPDTGTTMTVWLPLAHEQ